MSLILNPFTSYMTFDFSKNYQRMTEVSFRQILTSIYHIVIEKPCKKMTMWQSKASYVGPSISVLS